MKQNRLFPVLVFLLLFGAMECAQVLLTYFTRPSEIPVTRGTLPRTSDPRIVPDVVDAYMIRNLRSTRVPGAILAIVKGDQVLYTAGYGRASNGSRVTPDTAMPIASLTKSFTAAAVLQLLEEGKIELDRPVREYLPDFTLADPRGAGITVRHLLNQTTGLSPQTLPSPALSLPSSLADELVWLKPATLASDPGKAFHYCNENYNILAALIERVSGTTYTQFVENRLLAPMGMRSSRAFLTTPAPGIAAGHLLLFGVPVVRDTPHEFSGGGDGMVSSANDLAQWLVLNSTDGSTGYERTLLSQDSIAAAHTASPPGSSYAFGWIRERLPDGTATVQHSGKLQTFSAHERLFPQTGYGYAVVLNAGHSFNAEASSFIAGLNAIMTGRKPLIGPPVILFGLPFGLIADSVVAMLTVLVMTIGIVGSMRARDWARRRAAESALRVALRLTPYVILAAGLVLFPALMAAVNRGAPVALGVIFSVWPPLVVLFGACAVSGACVVAFRIARLAAERSLRRADSSRMC